MATSPRSDFDLKTVPLCETDLHQLEALFDEQCEEWLSLLGWDYSGPSRLIREVARARELPGFSIVSGGVAIGFAYYAIDGGRCSIGDVYISQPWRGLGADREVMAAVLDQIDRLGRVHRIESQCVSVHNESADSLFQSRGFSRLERHYMALQLDSTPSPQVHPLDYRSELTTRSWRSDDFSQAARIIHRSYKGEHDSLINSQYRTEEGCADLLTILTDHIWCGNFLPQASRVAVGPRGSLAAVLISTRIAPRSGHVAQISVHPAHQNRGIGRRLLNESLSELRRLGYASASLAVTASNAAAHHLYESCGFGTVHSFPVFYRESG